jgi:luciferase family oxidoreductase group 1
MWVSSFDVRYVCRPRYAQVPWNFCEPRAVGAEVNLETARAALRPIRFSVLDRSRTRRGESPAETLRATVRFAGAAESFGYHRFWVSEHHGVPGVAGSAPTVLTAGVAAATSTIRVGTGGVMLPNHQPLVVAEQFGVLASLHPGRIDMGLGRSVGFTDGVRRALGREKDAADRFAEQLAELLGYFEGPDAEGPPGSRVRALPAEGLQVPAFVLATGSGGEHAAAFGLPLVTAPFGGRDGESPEEALRRRAAEYRERFRPSALWPEPYVVVSLPVAVAETAEQARRLLLPEAWAMAWSRTRGVFPPLAPAEDIPEPDAMSARERTAFEQAQRGGISGTGPEVAAALAELLGNVGADEVLVSTSTFDRAEQLDSYRRLAALGGLVGLDVPASV